MRIIHTCIACAFYARSVRVACVLYVFRVCVCVLFVCVLYAYSTSCGLLFAFCSRVVCMLYDLFLLCVSVVCAFVRGGLV